MPAADYYRVLQIDPDAEPEVVAAAYRKLAAKYHPDVNGSPEAAERMREINVAYDTLGDPYKRAEYDRTKAPRWALPGTAGAAVPREPAPQSSVEQLVRTLVFMVVSSVIFSLVARAFAGPQGMTVALLIILAIVLWKGNTIMRYLGRR